MSFDEQPDGDLHGECSAEIHALTEQLREALEAHDKEVINKLAAWMTERGIGTGHGDTIDGLLAEFDAHDKEVRAKALEDASKKCIAGNWAELMLLEMAAAIRAEG